MSAWIRILTAIVCASALFASGCSLVGPDPDAAERTLSQQADEEGYGDSIEYSASETKGAGFVSAKAQLGEVSPEEVLNVLAFIEEQFDSDVTDGFSDDITVNWKVGATDVSVSRSADLALIRAITDLVGSSERVTGVHVDDDVQGISVLMRPCDNSECLATTQQSMGSKLDEFYRQYLLSSRGASIESGHFFLGDFNLIFEGPDGDYIYDALNLGWMSREDSFADDFDVESPVTDALLDVANVMEASHPYALTNVNVPARSIRLERVDTDLDLDEDHDAALDNVLDIACGRFEEVDVDGIEIDLNTDQRCRR